MASLKTGAQGQTIDAAEHATRELNAFLRALGDGERAQIANPAARHSLAVGLTERCSVVIDGDAGYYAGAMCSGADVTVRGHAGNGAGENIEAGTLTILGDAGGSLGASARGGRVLALGDAGARAGIAQKGGEVIVGGDTGAFCGFMMQAGLLVICGNAGANLGDSLYEGLIYVGGSIESLGADAASEPASVAEERWLREHLGAAGLTAPPDAFTRVATLRRLYSFDAGSWKGAGAA